MKKLIAVALLAAMPALAQQPSPAEQDAELRRAATAEQRNQQADLVAALSARLRIVEAELEKAKKAAESCKPKEEKK